LLEAEAPLLREWFIVFQSSSFSSALLTRQIGEDMQHEFGRGRLYQGLLTLEDDVITPLARLISNSLNLADTETESLYVPRPISTYFQEFSGYMERAQSQLNNLYQNLSIRTAALERMETIVKSMMSRHAWDDAIFNLNTPEPQPEHSRRTLSIMFTDIQNFTPLFNSVNVGELTSLLNKYFNIVTTVIYQHHGDIDKFLGDGMLAFFQNPHDALSAAVELQSRLAYFNNQNAIHLEIQLNTRLGISTGECIIARIGSDDRRETTLIGDAVNISSRLQTYSPANGIALDEATHNKLGMAFQMQGRDVNVKGKGIQRIYTAEFEELNALKKNTTSN
jgi:class 3 adenylate cyclase